MLDTLKKIFTPTGKKIVITIILYFVTLLSSGILALSSTGSTPSDAYKQVIFIISAIINPGTFLTPFLLLLLPKNINPQSPIFLILFALQPVVQIVYLYIILSIIFHLKHRPKKVEVNNQDHVDSDKKPQTMP